MESDKYKIQVIGHSKKDGHTEYVISVENNGSTFTFTERYSGLRNLSEAMRKSTNKGNFPKFPPKKFFGGDDEKFLSRRQQELNTFFELISKDSDFTSLPCFVKFIKEKKVIEEKKEGNKINEIKTPQIKKEVEKVEEKERIRSFKEIEIDCKKVVKDFNPRFYYMTNYYDKEAENNNTKFIKFFKSNKIENEQTEVILDKGDENNFNFINKDENQLENIENKIKEKFGKISELYKSLENIYSTDDIVVPI